MDEGPEKNLIRPKSGSDEDIIAFMKEEYPSFAEATKAILERNKLIDKKYNLEAQIDITLHYSRYPDLQKDMNVSVDDLEKERQAIEAQLNDATYLARQARDKAEDATDTDMFKRWGAAMQDCLNQKKDEERK